MKINSLWTWSSQKTEILSEVTSFLPLKFEFVNCLFSNQKNLTYLL